jgi:hypothetical protein
MNKIKFTDKLKIVVEKSDLRPEDAEELARMKDTAETVVETEDQWVFINNCRTAHFKHFDIRQQLCWAEIPYEEVCPYGPPIAGVPTSCWATGLTFSEFFLAALRCRLELARFRESPYVEAA